MYFVFLVFGHWDNPVKRILFHLSLSLSSAVSLWFVPGSTISTSLFAQSSHHIPSKTTSAYRCFFYPIPPLLLHHFSAGPAHVSLLFTASLDRHGLWNRFWSSSLFRILRILCRFIQQFLILLSLSFFY